MRKLTRAQRESDITDQLLDIAYQKYPDDKALLVAGAFMRVSVAILTEIAGEDLAEKAACEAFRKILNERKPRYLQ